MEGKDFTEMNADQLIKTHYSQTSLYVKQIMPVIEEHLTKVALNTATIFLHERSIELLHLKNEMYMHLQKVRRMIFPLELNR